MLARTVPDTEVRIVVGMAAGADYLVADLAVRHGFRVDAILPMPLAEYARDFSADELRDLEAILAHKKVQVTVLPAPGGQEGRDPAIKEVRNSLYVNLSDYLIRKSNVLIALWDGVASPLPGGTADTVLRFLGAREGSRSATHIDFVDDPDLPAWGHQFVYWIPATRMAAGSESTNDSPAYLSAVGEQLLRRQREMPLELQQQLEQLNAYNAEYSRLRGQPGLQFPDSLLGVIPAGIGPAEMEALKDIDLEYGKADALAVFCQRHSDRLFKWFSIMASAMGFFFLVYAKLVASKAFLFVYLLLLLLGVGIFYSVQGRGWFTKHLVYRVLAETMRVKFFLRLAAADQHVNAEQLIALTGIDKFAGFSWITTVLKHVDPFYPPAHPDGEASKRARAAVKEAWIEGQLRYFSNKVRRMGATHHRLEKLKSLLFYGLVLVAIALLVFGNALSAFRPVSAGPTMKDILMFFMGLLPVWLGIWELYQGKMATRELLWQYQNQLSHYSRARLQLLKETGSDREAIVIADLGRDSLMEGYLWTIHRFHREHEPPTAS